VIVRERSIISKTIAGGSRPFHTPVGLQDPGVDVEPDVVIGDHDDVGVGIVKVGRVSVVHVVLL
jgi:hypothetical protein